MHVHTMMLILSYDKRPPHFNYHHAPYFNNDAPWNLAFYQELQLVLEIQKLALSVCMPCLVVWDSGGRALDLIRALIP